MPLSSNPVIITNLSAGAAISGSIPSGQTTGGNPSGQYLFSYGVYMVDTVDPTLGVVLGGVDSNWEDVSIWNKQFDVTRYVPYGRLTPIASYRRTNYWKASRIYFIPAQDYNGTQLVYGKDVVASLSAMADSHNPIFYRDPNSVTTYVIVENFILESEENWHFVVKFDLWECPPPNGVVDTRVFAY